MVASLCYHTHIIINVSPYGQLPSTQRTAL